MKRLLIRAVTAPVAVGVAVAGIVALPTTSNANAPEPRVTGTGLQPSNDYPQPGSMGATWSDLPGGVAARPYISSMSLDNGGSVTPLITNGTTSAPVVGAGDVTASIAPLNLCPPGVSPSSGSCYATPNRIGIAVGYRNGDAMSMDLGNNAVNQQVDANTVIDMTVKLNTLGQTMRWSWANGDLQHWDTSNLGTPDATARIRFKPVRSPDFNDWSALPAGNGCTATPVFNCDIVKTDGEFLGANLMMSLDNTVEDSLSGAIFATQGAISGFLSPAGSPVAPTLDLQVASAHFLADGATLNRGRIKAFLPSQTLLNLYGVLPADASTFFTTTRTGSSGTNSAPTFTEWRASQHGSDGLLVDISGITFSAPTYKVKGKTTSVRSKAKLKGKATTVRIAKVKKCAKGACVATVFRLGKNHYDSKAKKVGAAKSAKAGTTTIKVAKAKLKKKNRYLVVVRSAKGKTKGKLLQSGIGTVR